MTMRSMSLSIFFLFVFAVVHEGLHVHGPSGPVVAQLGGSVLLPCFIVNPLPLEGLQVEWRKMGSYSIVNHVQQGKSRPDLQSQLFRGRVDFFPDELTKGNFSILLKNVVEEDAGGYRCQINTTQDSSEVQMEIKNIRSLVVMGGDRAIFADGGQDVTLNCSVDSHVPISEIEEVTWKKINRDRDILVLLYQDSEIFPDSSHERYQGRVEFFSSEIPKGNFSLKLRDVKVEDKGEFMCEVHTRNMSGHTIVLLQGVESLVVMGGDRAIFADGGQDVTLNCSVDSHIPISEIEEVAWKKIGRDQDILVLLYQDSEIFPDSSHERYQGRVEFFSSEIPKGNFSLKLRDVKVEDKGEFMCEVHTRNMSGHTIVLLQGVALSAHHIAVLVLCSVTVLFAMGFCGPVLIVLRKKDASKKDMKRHIFLILCPNICMFITFCLWSTEGILSEVISCSTVSIMRPVILVKTSSYLGILPQCLQKAVKALAFPIYHAIIAATACSLFFGNFAMIYFIPQHIITVLAVLEVVCGIGAVVLAVYGLQMHLTICLEIFNLALLGFLLWNSYSILDYSFEIASVITPQIVGMMVVLSLQRHLFQGKPFGRVYIAVSSVILTLVILGEISVYILLSITINDFAKGWVILFESVLCLSAWLVVIYLLCCYQRHRQGCCSQWRKIGYLCCSIIVAFLITASGAGSFHYVYIIMENKDHAGYLALIVLVHVLTATCLFKHPKHLPGLLHTMIYMFGAVGLSTINAIALATELILKAVKGTRTIEDLRVIVLPLETVFLIAWLALQIYDAWTRLKDRIKRNFEDEQTAGPETVLETELLSNPDPHPDESEVISKL